jgi:predicted small lipoprotein YifL
VRRRSGYDKQGFGRPLAGLRRVVRRWGFALPLDRRIVFRAALAAVLMSAVGLSACGRKGALQPPPKADVTGEEQPADPDAGKPDRKFPLDFLL